MERVKVLVSLPRALKVKLDALRAKGYTVSGFIRSLLDEHFKHTPATGRKGR